MAPLPKPDETRLLAVLERLISIDTQNAPGRNYGRIAATLSEELEGLGFRVSLHTPPMELQVRHVPDAEQFPRTNVVARLDVGAKKTLHFNAHFDVVPAAPAGWTSDPFTFRRDKGWVYGRGTADMKGAIASMLEAARILRASGTRPSCNIEFSFVCDEETGSELGAAWLVREGIVKPDFAVVGEGGSKSNICIGHNGTLWYEVTVAGRSAHASTPERGLNAFDRACDLAVGLRAYIAKLSKRRFTSPDGQVLRATLNVGGEAATGPGGKINTVPNHFAFTLDRRVLPNESFASVDKELRAELAALRARTPGLRYKLRCLERNLPCLVDGSGPLPTAFATALQAERRNKPVFSVTTGFNDMHWFAVLAKIPVVAYGPGGERYHGVDERAKVKDLVETAATYARLMATFAG